METLVTEYDFETFQFVKLKIPSLIPYELVENVKGRVFTPEEFYQYQNEHVNDPYNFLFALIDEDNIIQGFLWAVQEKLGKILYVNTLSISKDYWHKGKIMPKVCKFLDHLYDVLQPTKVQWATTNEKFFLKKGFKRSKIALMEYQRAN